MASLRFLLRDNSIISLLEQDTLPYFKSRFVEFATLKNEQVIMSKSAKNALSNAFYVCEYNFSLNGLEYKIENYDFCDTCVLEVEFRDAGQIIDYKMPEFLNAHCLKNITNDENYEKKSLALFGKPDYELDFNKVLSRTKLFGDFALVIPGKISASKGARIVLFGILENTNFATLQFLSKKSSKNLLRLFAAMEKNLAILSVFDVLFDEKIINNFKSLFLSLKDEISELCNKNYLCEYISAQNIAYPRFSSLNNERNIKEDDFVLKLSSFCQSLKEWAFLLEDDGEFYCSELGKNELKSTFAPLLVSALDEFVSCDENELEKSAKYLAHLFSSFGELYNAKLCAKLSKNLNKINNLFAQNEKCEFLRTKLDLPQMRVINAELKKSIEKSSKKIMKNYKKAVKTAKIYTEILKVYYKG